MFTVRYASPAVCASALGPLGDGGVVRARVMPSQSNEDRSLRVGSRAGSKRYGAANYY